MSSAHFEDFTNSYNLSKTLRFSLLPQGKTLDYIKEGAFINEDQQRADDYKSMKTSIDAYHQDFIEKAMNVLIQEAKNSENSEAKAFKYQDLENFLATYTEFRKDRKKNRKNFDKFCDSLRKLNSNFIAKK